MQEQRKPLVANWAFSLSPLPFQLGGGYRLFSEESVSRDSCLKCDLKEQSLTFQVLLMKLIMTCPVEIMYSVNIYRAPSMFQAVFRDKRHNDKLGDQAAYSQLIHPVLTIL